MPLLIVVAVLIVVGVVWRARVTRRLTIEESVDRYRRTLSAVHDATVRSRVGEAASPAATFRPRAGRTLALPSRRLVGGAVAAALVLVVVAVAATRHGGGGGHPRAAAPTTTRPHATSTTSTTVAAPTTTVPLIRPADATGTAFTIGKLSYTLVLQSNNGACWIDARDPSGTELFTGVLSNGASQTITATNATVRLGNPGAVSLTVDGTPVPFLAPNGSPVTLHFQGVTV